MSQRRAKKARRYVRDLTTYASRDLAWPDHALDLFFTPRERRRAEAVAARTPHTRDDQPTFTVTLTDTDSAGEPGT